MISLGGFVVSIPAPSAIARNEGDNRPLLVMATGTGKTYVALAAA
jgi:superfamily II DNA or RNA helicase